MLYYPHMAKRIDHAARRQFIVERSMGLFAMMGYAKVSFLDISEATGIARTALYRYFKTKREIFDEAIHGTTSRIKRELEKVVVKPLPVAKRLELACAMVVDVLHGKKAFFLAIFDFVFSMVRTGEDMSAKIEQFTGGFRVVLRTLIAEGIASGELRRNVDPDDAADALYALMESVALRVLLGVEAEPRAAKRRFSAMIAALLA